MQLKQLMSGMATYVPGARRNRATSVGGTSSARYCYSVWLRHLVTAKQSGLAPHPKVVVELGPGDSLGAGLAALISGCDRYVAFDVVESATPERNAAIFDELVTLFERRAPIPANDEFPKVKPQLDRYDFPADILDEGRLRRALDGSRLDTIRRSIRDPRGKDSVVRYTVPWCTTTSLEPQSVDMVYSQAVLEYVDDLKGTYAAMHAWLRPSGFISHQIDFKCHGTSDDWNGHWAYSDVMWTLLRGKRLYFLNREVHSTHIAEAIDAGFEIVCDKRIESESRLAKGDLAPRFRSMSDDDLITSGALIQAIKPKEGRA